LVTSCIRQDDTIHSSHIPIRDNIFVVMNILTVDELAHFFQTIGQPARLQILLAIGEGETCVCHLEAMLNLRQAALSQHLMALRKSGLVTARRAGRFIHYRLKTPALLYIIHQAAQAQGISLPELSPSSECSCPNCCKQKGECHS
jgi:DNA-binding transcriptional ArsR family regulator